MVDVHARSCQIDEFCNPDTDICDNVPTQAYVDENCKILDESKFEACLAKLDELVAAGECALDSPLACVDSYSCGEIS
jgi:hypothetical protein